MRVSWLTLTAGCMAAVSLAACGGAPAPAPAATEPAATAVAGAAGPAATPGGAAPDTVMLPTGFPERPFVRVPFDTLTWRPTEGNTLGVETAVVEGDPSKPGYYLTINHFPRGVMSRPHYHPDERYIIVLRGTWYTDEGDVFRPDRTVPLKPGDFMRHPKGGPHYDGALDEDTWVAISGYGPTQATVIDGGALFGRSLPAAQAGDRLDGTWQLNVARSTYAGAAPPRSQTTTLRAVDGGMHEIVERANADGTTTRWELTARYDGRDYPVTGDPSRETAAMTRVDPHTVDVVNKKAGAVVSRMRIVVAADGRSRTNTVMDPSGRKTTAVLVFDRR